MSRGRKVRKVILYFIDCILLYKTAVCKAVSVNENCLKDITCIVYHVVSKLNKDFKTT